MEAFLPYLFFIYMFIATYIILMNYDKIKNFSSNMRYCNAFISIVIALFVFVGVATVYNLENRNENYKEKIKEICPEINLIM